MRSVVFGVVLGAVACGTSGGTDSDVVVDLGVIATDDSGQPLIEHPPAVRLGTEVSVTVNTEGCGECIQVERTDVTVNGLEVSIWPYDRTRLGVCGDCLNGFPHTVNVWFDERGTAVIRAYGYAAGDRFGTMIERQSTLTVD